MKATTVFGQIVATAFVLLLIVMPAQAKLGTGSTQPVIAISADDTAIATGPAGTLLESSYFNAPHAPVGATRSCRLPMSLFDKTRLARACN